MPRSAHDPCDVPGVQADSSVARLVKAGDMASELPELRDLLSTLVGTGRRSTAQTPLRRPSDGPSEGVVRRIEPMRCRSVWRAQPVVHLDAAYDYQP